MALLKNRYLPATKSEMAKIDQRHLCRTAKKDGGTIKVSLPTLDTIPCIQNAKKSSPGSQLFHLFFFDTRFDGDNVKISCLCRKNAVSVLFLIIMRYLPSRAENLLTCSQVRTSRQISYLGGLSVGQNLDLDGIKESPTTSFSNMVQN